MHLDPAKILELLVADLTPFVREQKGSLVEAADPWNFLELLAESPSGWLCVVHWAGDDNTQTEIPEAIMKHELHVGIACSRGLAAKPGEAVRKKRPGNAPSLLQLVTLTRSRVRSFVFPEGVSTMHPILLGTDPVSTPDGVPLPAYRLRFSLIANDEPVTPRE